MSRYRLVVHVGTEGPVRTLSVNLKNREEALIVAQRYDAPAELWDGEERLCNINRSAGMWVISSEERREIA